MRRNSTSALSFVDGFTLIEVLVVVALLAIITTIATPSWKRLVVSTEVRSAVNDYAVSLQTARAEAIRQRQPVTVCPSSNGSTCTSTASYDLGWILVMGTTTSPGRVLNDFFPLKRVTMTTNKAAGSSAITYLANGLPIGNFTGMRITVQDSSASVDSSLTRYICIARTGRSRVFTEDQWLAIPSGECS